MSAENEFDLIAKTAQTSRGEVRYADFGGEGPVIVALHGTPGGFDHAIEQSKFLARAGFRIIAPSRPGYPGTPLTDELRSMSAQADLIAALLDELKIDEAAIYSWSGGGPTGYYFALKYPQRVTALVALAAVCEPIIWEQSAADRFFLRTKLGFWLMKRMADHVPDQVVSGELGSESDLSEEEVKTRTEAILADPVKRSFALNFAKIMTTSGDRKAGSDNDLAIFENLEPIALEQISAPTLIVQGTVDKDLKPEQSYHAAERIPGARLLKIENAGHLGLFLEPGGDEAQTEIIDFVSAHSK